ncbi:MAG: hypothetical protein ACREMK_06485 [Gemmatimonadota bacterium]
MAKVFQRALGGLFSCLAAMSCGDDPSGPTRDSLLFDIVLPTAQAYDRDGDGLVDLEIAFSQTGPAVNLTTLEIRSSRPLGPNGEGGTDLREAFEVVSLDAEAAVLEETTDALLPDGEVEIIVRGEDQAGASSEEAVTITLPAGAFHRYLESRVDSREPLRIETIPGDTLGFLLTSEFEIVPFHTQKLEVLPRISIGAVRDPVDGVWDPVTERLYIVSDAVGLLVVVDPKTLAVEGPIPIAARGIGIERGPASGLLYVSLATTAASIAVVDPVARSQVRVIQTAIVDPLNPGSPAFIGEPQVSLSEEVIYVPRFVTPGGVLGIDPISFEVLVEVDIGSNDNNLGFGLPVDSVLDVLRMRLFVTDQASPPLAGLAEVDTETNKLVRRINSGQHTGRMIALSPGGERVFVTLNTLPGSTQQGENWLIDTNSFTVLERFQDNPRSEFGDNDPAFRPDGQLIFVPSGNGIGVYLNRE